MSAEWFGPTDFAVAPLRAGFNLTLGKMLQPVRVGTSDVETNYLSSASIQTRGIQTDVEKTMWATPMEVRKYKVEHGDLMVCEGGDVGRSFLIKEALEGVIFQNSVHRIRPRPGAGDTRYLAHLLWLLHGSGYLDVLCNKATIRHLTADKLASLQIPLPPLAVQRRIADFLDDQVARIDETIRLREQQFRALASRDSVAFDASLVGRGWVSPATLDVDWSEWRLPDGWRVARLSQVLRQLTNGYVGPTRDILVDEGIRYIQGTHIKDGGIDFNRRHFFVRPDWHTARPRINLRGGDVLIVQTGDIGRVAVVPNDFGPASCHALLIARVRKDALTGEYLGAYLGSWFGYQSLLSRATGALHPHLEGGIRDVPVALPPLGVQAQIVEEVGSTRRATRMARQEMKHQTAGLLERKCSLITAAVTGKFDVSTASGREVMTG